MLRENRVTILQSADSHDIVLNRLLDHLLSKNCIQQDQKELIKRKEVSKDRMGTLLDFLSSEGRIAFDELCTAFENFGTQDKKDLASTLRLSISQKQQNKMGTDAGKCSHVVY